MAEENDTDDAPEEETDAAAEASDDTDAGSPGETEAGGEEASAEEGAEGEDFDEEMLRAMQEEMSRDDEGDAASDDDDSTGESEDDLESQMIQAMASETGASTEATAAAVEHVGGIPEGASPENIRRVLDIKLSVAIELGTTDQDISTILHWTEGSLIELDKVSGEPVDVIINRKPYARGEVVVIAENFGVRLTEISPAPSRGPV